MMPESYLLYGHDCFIECAAEHSYKFISNIVRCYLNSRAVDCVY